MSKSHHGLREPSSLPAQRPASGLFFLCSFLLLIGIPASAYFEIWAKACQNGGSPGAVILESGSMTMQRYHHYGSGTDAKSFYPAAQQKGAEIAQELPPAP